MLHAWLRSRSATTTARRSKSATASYGTFFSAEITVELLTSGGAELCALFARDLRTDELTGAIRYYDCQVDDARLVVNIARTL